jgi:GNAT superfamily N-acetyltransferase
MRYYEFITESQVLTERGSSVLFHYTSTPAAKKILSSGNFELASVVGNRSEEKYAPEGYSYFLSLTRTVTGDYHRWVGTGAVLFKLDGDWFNSRYIVNPIDYWERSWLHSDGTRTREAEDRVFSKEATIPNNAITEVHVLLKEQHEFRSPETRQLMILSKQQKLPVYLYTDEQAWRLLDKRRATTPSAARSVLRGAPAHGGSSRKPTDYVKPWIELIEKNKREQLSDRAQRLLKNIMYYSRDDEDNNMGVDLSNARKPNAGDRASAVELIGYLQKNGYGNNTVKLKNDLVAKWNPIWAAAEKAKQGVAEGSENNRISFQVQKGKNKFATTLSIGNNPVGVYQYDADTGRSIAEVYPEFKGKGLGKLLVLHAIYTAAQLGLDFQEDESRTSEYDNVLDSLSSHGYVVDDDGYWYVTGEGEQYLQQSMKQGVAEGLTESTLSDHEDELREFVKWTCDKLKIKEPPRIEFQDSKDSEPQTKTAHFDPTDKIIWIYTGNRNLADIMRSVAHELTHRKQDEKGQVNQEQNYPGSPIEQQADAVAGYLMKLYLDKKPGSLE